jgi:hypothetical protein
LLAAAALAAERGQAAIARPFAKGTLWVGKANKNRAPGAGIGAPFFLIGSVRE